MISENDVHSFCVKIERLVANELLDCVGLSYTDSMFAGYAPVYEWTVDIIKCI